MYCPPPTPHVCLPASLISTLHTGLAHWRGEGPLKAVEVALKSSLKGGISQRRGARILNRTERGGGERVLGISGGGPTYSLVNAGGGWSAGRKGGGGLHVHSSRAT